MIKQIHILTSVALIFLVISVKAHAQQVDMNDIPSLPDAFDWRSQHQFNAMTTVKNQKVDGPCENFATISAVEALLNLYSNQLLNLDLSEQDLISCPVMNGKYQVSDEKCLPYQGNDPQYRFCAQKCSAPAYQVSWDSNSYSILSDVDTNEIRRTLITKGPLVAPINQWDHVALLVGYRVDPNDHRIEWIFKNSFGSTWQSRGYFYSKNWPDGGGFVGFYNTAPLLSTPKTVQCSDRDHDGYCYWGLSDDTSHCPSSCRRQNDGVLLKDIDDGNAMVHESEKDLWISAVRFNDQVFRDDGQQNVEIGLSLDGDDSNCVISTNVLFYINGQLMSQQKVLLKNKDTKKIVFSWKPKKLGMNSLNIVALPIKEESSNRQTNNFYSRDVWVYNYKSGFNVQNGEIFDCKTSQNQEGRPIEAIYGPQQKQKVGFTVYGVHDAQIRNCSVGGWDTGLELTNTNHIYVSRNYFSLNSTDVLIKRSDPVRIEDNTFENSTTSIQLGSVDDLTQGGHCIIRNRFNKSSTAISVWYVPANIIDSNYFDTEMKSAISLYHSSNNFLKDNVFINPSYGITLTSSNNNFISHNTFGSTVSAFTLTNANSNQLFQNTFYLNNPAYPYPELGILYSGSANTFWGNDFLNGTAREFQDAKHNTWDYKEEGNFWFDWLQNPSYPKYYKIPGEGGGIDQYPKKQNIFKEATTKERTI